MQYSYRTPFGLPVRYTLESDTHIENEFLFGVYEAIFTKCSTTELLNYFTMAIQRKFPNHVSGSVKQKKLSHDQSTAYKCFKKLFVKMVGNFPEIPLSSDSHPRDVIFFKLLDNKKLSTFEKCLFYSTCFASLNIGYRINNWRVEKKLSGELLWVLRYETLKSDPGLIEYAGVLKSIIRKGATRRFGGVKEMVSNYFYNDENHPIIKNWVYKL